jgi:hypothetical protein
MGIWDSVLLTHGLYPMTTSFVNTLTLFASNRRFHHPAQFPSISDSMFVIVSGSTEPSFHPLVMPKPGKVVDLLLVVRVELGYSPFPRRIAG